MDGIGGLLNFSILILFFPLISLCSSFDKVVYFLVEYNQNWTFQQALKMCASDTFNVLCTQGLHLDFHSMLFLFSSLALWLQI